MLEPDKRVVEVILVDGGEDEVLGLALGQLTDHPDGHAGLEVGLGGALVHGHLLLQLGGGGAWNILDVVHGLDLFVCGLQDLVHF